MRFFSAFLVFTLLFACIPVSAAAANTSSGILVDKASVEAWNNKFGPFLLTGVIGSVAQAGFWSSTDSLFSVVGVGPLNSSGSLVSVVSSLDKRYNSASASFERWFTQGFLGLFTVGNIVTKFDSSRGVYRPYNKGAGLWMVNSKGHFPYFDPSASSASSGPGGQWLRTDQCKTNYNVLSEAALLDLVSVLNSSSQYCSVSDYGTGYKAIFAAPESGLRGMLYCDEVSRPYVCPAASDSFAVNQSNNYYTEENNTTNNNTTVIDQGDTVNNTVINLEDNSVWYPDGTWNFIDQLLYDASTKTYYVDSHDSYTWNETTNNYVTNNYNSFYQYHINYTSITYIGTTAEYDKTYELYYQLPDGRSSADLTAEDLEQLSLVFADVVNYKRSADDVSQRALYHFDGDTQDSSYWSYCSDFHWNAGASLTYMDEGTFGGSLYLDETAHGFTMTLPNNDISADFTLQFRYYQSYTAAPQLDSSISLGGVKVFQWDGAKYYTGTGTAICATSVGNWNEICIMRKDSVLYYYINGVPYTSVPDNGFQGNTVYFQFGSKQQTYKKLDELRFTRGCVYEVGANYTPSSVPFDTNLSLILPDGEYPVADEVLSVISGDGNMLLSAGISDWTDSGVVARFSSGPRFSAGYPLYYNSEHTQLSFDGDSVLVSHDSYVSNDSWGSSPRLSAGLFLPLYCCSWVVYNGRWSSLQYSNYLGFSRGKNYCLSVVLSDGTSSSLTFQYTVGSFSGFDESTFKTVSSSINSCISFSGSSVYCLTNSDGSDYRKSYRGVLLSVDSGATADIVYMELVEGDKPSFALDWHSAVYSSGQLEESPVLAVRSNLDVATYQIGGVRPSYPSKGQVWALVENSRITSLQQYNGSAWVSVDGRIWTGVRWIPYSSFDVVTLQDCFDIVDSSGDDVEYIYTESGFWAWWQRTWKSFTLRLDSWFEKLLAALGGDGSGSDGGIGSGSDVGFWQRIKNAIADGLASVIELLFDLIKIVLEQVLSLVQELLSFFFDMLTGMVVSGVGNFFSAFTDGSLFGFFQQEQVGEDGTVSTVVGLPDDIAGVFGFFSAVILLLPAELRSILIFGIAAAVLFSVIKLVKS